MRTLTSLLSSSVLLTQLGELGVRTGGHYRICIFKFRAPRIHNLFSYRLERRSNAPSDPWEMFFWIQQTTNTTHLGLELTAHQWVDCLNGSPRQDHLNLYKAGPAEWQEEGALLESPCSASCWIMGCYRAVERKKEHRGTVGCNCSKTPIQILTRPEPA